MNCPRATSRRRRKPSAPRTSDRMRRARQVKAAGAWNTADAVDCVALDAQDRHRRRIVLTGERGITFMLDLPRATALRDGDGLLLDNDAIESVAGNTKP